MRGGPKHTVDNAPVDVGMVLGVFWYGTREVGPGDGLDGDAVDLGMAMGTLVDRMPMSKGVRRDIVSNGLISKIIIRGQILLFKMPVV
jgi:hypothetical protein